MKNKILFLALSFLLCALVLGACAKKERDLSEIKKSGEIVMFTNAEFPPYEYIGDNSQPAGIDVDIANEIAKEIGVKLRIINASFDGFSLALQNAQADMAISAISITPERQETLDFSIPYVNTIQYILRFENDESINTIDDLAGKKAGVQLGTTGDFLLSDQIADGVLKGSGAQVMQYKSLQEALLALKKGDIAAIVSDEGPIKNLKAENPQTVCFQGKLANGSLEDEYYGIAVKKGNTDLINKINEVLANLITSGFVGERGAYHTEKSINQQ
ncbi:MAG: transporter substrate-binding domain-containing protein [Termitinemataceae bacterium]|nr:MAG: transporter substrate-binding domain-containing protein [Termitinemataceae bacterium]